MKYILTLLSFLLLTVFASAQEKKVPLERNVLLNEANSSFMNNIKENISFGKTGNLTIPFNDYFNNKFSSKPDRTKWVDSSVTIDHLNAIFNSKNANNVIYNYGFGEADILTSQQFNTTNAGGNAFVLMNYSTGSDWNNTDSLLFQVKGNTGVWYTLWVSNNNTAINKDVLLNIDFFDNLKSNLLQFRLVSYCNTDTVKNEVFKVHQFIVSYKNKLPFYESFRQFMPFNF